MADGQEKVGKILDPFYISGVLREAECVRGMTRKTPARKAYDLLTTASAAFAPYFESRAVGDLAVFHGMLAVLRDAKVLRTPEIRVEFQRPPARAYRWDAGMWQGAVSRKRRGVV